MFKRKNRDRIHTLIDADTRIHGDVEFAGGLHLDGYVQGDVRARGPGRSFLSVSARGRIEGSVSADDVRVDGVVTGDIGAGGRVQLGPTARVHGNVRYALIESAVGAQINGKLVHRPEEPVGPPPGVINGDPGENGRSGGPPPSGRPPDAEPPGAATAAPGGQPDVLIGHRRTG